MERGVQWFGEIAAQQVNVRGPGDSFTYIRTDALGTPVARTNGGGALVSRTLCEPLTGFLENYDFNKGDRTFAAEIAIKIGNMLRQGVVILDSMFVMESKGQTNHVKKIACNCCVGHNPRCNFLYI